LGLQILGRKNQSGYTLARQKGLDLTPLSIAGFSSLLSVQIFPNQFLVTNQQPSFVAGDKSSISQQDSGTIMAGSTYLPPDVLPPGRKKGLIAGLLKGNQWVFISPLTA